MTETLAIYGTGGFAREMLAPLKHSASVQNQMDGETPEIVFVDDDPTKHGATILGQAVVSYKEASSRDAKFCVAVGDPSARRRITEQLEADQALFFSIFANNLIDPYNVTVGPGSILCDHVMITTDGIQIGKSFHANIYSYVAHDCDIGDYVTLAPRASVNGNVTIGDGAYIGTNASIKQGITIGKGAVVGMGAVVTKSVAPGVTVVGNPARPIGA